MNSLPRSARIFVLAVIAAGVASCVGVFFIPDAGNRYESWEVVVFAALGLVAGGYKVRLTPRHMRENDEKCSISLGYMIAFAALARCGPETGLLTAVLSTLTSGVFPKRQKPHQLSFNLGLSALESLVGASVYYSALSILPKEGPGAIFVAAFGAGTAMFLVNTFGVATVVSVVSDTPMRKLWGDGFLWAIPSFLGGASVSALAVHFFADTVGATLLFAAPVAVLTFYTYNLYGKREQERVDHIATLQKNQVQLEDLYSSTIRTLALAIDAKDEHTHDHILRVQRYAVAIAEHMKLEERELEGVRMGALLHDIGKLGIPENVLLKPGKLTEEEFEIIKTHPQVGANILHPVDFPWPVIPVVRHHHEKFDGSGYPDGLKGEAIPITARVMAVADVYDALTSDRSYRDAWPHEKAMALIVGESGAHFDPEVVKALVAIVDDVRAELAAEGIEPKATHDLSRNVV